MYLKENEFAELKDKIQKMGALVEDAVRNSVTSLLDRDVEHAEIIIDGDTPINTFDNELDEYCIKLIALRQPVAKDLRMITTAMKITTDLERIADNAVNIAERTIELADERYIASHISFPILRDITCGMVRDAVGSFVKEDKSLAFDVMSRDKEVDAINEKVLHDLLSMMLNDCDASIPATKLSYVSRYLERIGDHATNIAEMVIYMIEGQMIKHKADKDSFDINALNQ
ncbi:MAG: phosphate signaling complex protein PhoU [Nitrospirae bacterium]|nr:phosphate signaling complex protein PhoU [Nitrospirota bacterium]MBF0536555.1 phosphate signaling complex protein PhoU [Nitrospirota bacterium]MBF0618472.1 phosphate signaling complex protein PhoU [Nitrospirota bacterium]